MKRILTAGLAMVGTAAVLAAAGPASAAGTTPPPWQPGGTPAAGDTTGTDFNNIGRLSILDTNGNPVTTPQPSNAKFGFLIGEGQTPKAMNTKTFLLGRVPVKGTNPGAWSGELLGGATTFPRTTPPLNNETRPVHTPNTNANGDLTLDDFAADFPNVQTDPAYANIYELRMFTSGTGGGDGQYSSADVLYNPSAHTYTVIYPVVTATGTTLSVTPAAPAAAGTTETLTATIAPGVAGKVAFTNNGVALGSPVPVDTTGKATTTAVLPAGSNQLTAAFVATDSATYQASSSAAQTYMVTDGTPPPSALPEVPLAALLPLVGLTALGGTALLRRRRSATVGL